MTLLPTLCRRYANRACQIKNTLPNKRILALVFLALTLALALRRYANRACQIKNTPLPNKYTALEEDLLPSVPMGMGVMGVVQLQVRLRVWVCGYVCVWGGAEAGAHGCEAQCTASEVRLPAALHHPVDSIL